MVTYVLTDEEDLNSIADAIRTKNGDENATYRPSEMAPAILEIKGGGIEELPDNLAYLERIGSNEAFIGYGSSVTVDKTGADMDEINPIFQALYPIGSIYMSVTYFDPATVFGGVWERISGRFLLAADDSYAAGSTGGEATHTLTVNEMPSHYHKGIYWADPNGTALTGNAGGTASHALGISWNSGLAGSPIFTGSNGGSQAHNNMPPYLAVYVWKRTA